MRIERRTLHENERSSHPQLREVQNYVLNDLWQGDDLEIYDDEGNLIAVTSRDNPNLDELLASLNGATAGGNG